MRKTFGIVAFSRMASLQCASSDTTACRRHGRAPLNENGWARSWWLSISVCMNLLYCVSAIFHTPSPVINAHNKNPTLPARLVCLQTLDLRSLMTQIRRNCNTSRFTSQQSKKQSWSEPKRLHGGSSIRVSDGYKVGQVRGGEARWAAEAVTMPLAGRPSAARRSSSVYVRGGRRCLFLLSFG